MGSAVSTSATSLAVSVAEQKNGRDSVHPIWREEGIPNLILAPLTSGIIYAKFRCSPYYTTIRRKTSLISNFEKPLIHRIQELPPLLLLGAVGHSRDCA